MQDKNIFFIVLIQHDFSFFWQKKIKANYLQCKYILWKLEEFLTALFHSANTNKYLSMVWYPTLLSLLKTILYWAFQHGNTSVHKRKFLKNAENVRQKTNNTTFLSLLNSSTLISTNINDMTIMETKYGISAVLT